MSKFCFDDYLNVLDNIPKSIKDKKLSILLPLFNEQDLIVSSVQHIIKTMTAWSWNFEIIVSDDGSHDLSYPLLMEHFQNIPEVKLISSPRNYGKGRALSTAYEISTGEYILFLDSDLELPIEHVPYFFKKMLEEECDVVIGSKEDPRSNLQYPLLRKIFSLGYSFFVKILFGLPISDTQTGIKLFKRNTLEQTLPYLVVKKFAFDIELLVLINSKGFIIKSHPIVLNFIRQTSIGRMSLDTILHMFKDTLAIFWRMISGFWNIQTYSPSSLSYAVVSLDPNVQSFCKHIYFINEFSDLHVLISELEQYDLIIFLNEGEELPIFTPFALNRVFSDQHIQAIYPLIYPKDEHNKSFLYYSLLANMFFWKGYYPRYRAVRQKILKDYTGTLPINKCILRTQYLKELLSKDKTMIDNFSHIIHSPYVFIHENIPNTSDGWEKYVSQSEHMMGIKKQTFILYVFCLLIFIFGIFFSWIFCIPLILLESSILFWFIFSLGIRRGIKNIIVFYKNRFLIK